LPSGARKLSAAVINHCRMSCAMSLIVIET
jgi:hypothetical protein